MIYSPNGWTTRWMNDPSDERPIGWTTHWMNDPLDERPIGWTTHWMHDPLDERPIGWTTYWMHDPLDERPIGCTTHWMNENMPPTRGNTYDTRCKACRPLFILNTLDPSPLCIQSKCWQPNQASVLWKGNFRLLQCKKRHRTECTI